MVGTGLRGGRSQVVYIKALLSRLGKSKPAWEKEASTDSYDRMLCGL